MSKTLPQSTTVIFLLFFTAFPLSADKTKTNQEAAKSYQIKTNLNNPTDIGNLSRFLNKFEFDIAGTDWKNGEIEIITDPKGVSLLKTLPLNIKVFENLKRQKSSLDSRFLNPITLAQKLSELSSNYPLLAKVQTIGTSLQGRPILALLITNSQSQQDGFFSKPAIIFDGEHHAREIMTPEIVFDVATTLLNEYGKNPETTQIVDNWNIWLIPMVNPDGSNLVFNGKNMWRKNAHEERGQVFGVDINRNYAYKWNSCGGSSGFSWAQDYRGEFAASEPETRAVMSLADQVRPAAYLSYHSYSELVLYPYGCSGSRTPEDSMVERVAKQLANLLPSDSGNGTYTAGSAWELLYDVDGDSMGYMYANFGALSYTFEVNKDFQPRYTLRDPTVVKHRNAWKFFLNHINQNLLSIRTVDARTNQDVPALIEIDKITHVQDEPSFRTNAKGRFFKVLDQGQYLVSASLADGRNIKVPVLMRGVPESITIDIP